MSNEGQLRRRKEFRYKRYKDTRDGHRAVYREHYGPIPPGYDVHHKDENTKNNDPSNLIALPKTHHKRLHCGWKLVDDVWWKPCGRCRKLKPLTEFHKQANHNRQNGASHCKPCNVLDARDHDAKEKAKRLLELLPWSVPKTSPTDNRLGYVCV